ncbi:MAG: glyoxalase [Heyndrickxia sp.]
MSFRFQGIDHIQLAAPKGCEEQARHFFGDILGLTEIPKPENLRARGGCWFQCGKQEIHIGVEEDFKAAKKAHPGLVVSNIADLKKTLKLHQLTWKEEPPIEGRERMHVTDPFGNRMEFIEFISQ